MTLPTLDDPARELLATMARTHGVQGTAKRLGLSRHAVAALLGSAPVRAGTIALAAQCLARALQSDPQPSAA